MTRIWLSRAPHEIKTIPNIAGDANKSESFSLPLIITHNGYLWARRIFFIKIARNLILNLTALRHRRLFLDTFLFHSTLASEPWSLSSRLSVSRRPEIFSTNCHWRRYWSDFAQQNLSIEFLLPGDIGTLNTSHDMIKCMPKLSPRDVADAVIYAISTPENVLVRPESPSDVLK